MGMSTTSKSPRKVLLVAYAVGKEALPEYAHRYSPHTYTQPQLFACLALQQFTEGETVHALCNAVDDLIVARANIVSKIDDLTTNQLVRTGLRVALAILDRTTR